MKILIINPIFDLSFWDFSLCKDITGKQFPNPPLALPTLAAMVPDNFDIELIDENVEPISFESDADIVAITGFIIQKERVFEIADKFRQLGKTICIGGPVVEDSIIDECQQHADHVFQGEAEYTWPAFFKDLSQNDEKSLYIENERINMHDSPLPRFDLLKIDRYATAIIETSRGCPYSCEFCEIPARLGKKSRTKTVEQVMAEVKSLVNLGVDSIMFIDDHFVGSKRHTKKLLHELIDYVESINYAVNFSVQFTINLSKDDELLELFYRANFTRVFIGLETSRENSLKLAQKKQNTNIDLIEAVHKVQSYNIMVWAGLIVGFDGDDETVFDEQLEFIQAAGVTVAMIGILQAIPGTALYERLEKANRIKRDSTSGIRGTQNDLIYSNVIPEGMTPRALATGYQQLVAQAYTEENFAKRVITAIKSTIKPVHRKAKPISAEDKQVLLKTLKYFFSLRHPKRMWMFLKVVGYTLVNKPSHLETAFIHLVAHKHFQQFYQIVANLPFQEPDIISVVDLSSNEQAA
ncbi:MAG: radical SAM protein [Kangiellaceae bacterium]|jgi:radical SAM superfamily enzyme YgiQ (UPF0313 family)|nr:radical SAM protein [Kangiellaceae bacterium]